MDFRKNYKTFLKAYDLICKDNRRFKRFYDDKRITNYEKTLLKTLFAIKKGQSSKMIEKLLAIPSLGAFLDGIKLCLLGNCYNNTGQFKQAITSYKESINLLKSLDDDYYLFLPLTSIIESYVNLKDVVNLKTYYLELVDIKKMTKWREAKFLHVEATCMYLFGNNQKALENIEICLEKYPVEIKSQMAYLFTIKLMILFRLDKIDEFSITLEQYKTLKGYKIKENYKFMLTLSKYLFNNSSVYVYKSDFDSIPYLYHQLNTIKCLANNELDEAKDSWTFLMNANPDVYLENFKFNAEKTLFSEALEKAKKDFKEIDKNLFSMEELNKLETIQMKILYILKHSDGVISKEKLIQLIWNEQITEENSAKLAIQISRLRKKIKDEIRVKSGSYYLKKAS